MRAEGYDHRRACLYHLGCLVHPKIGGFSSHLPGKRYRWLSPTGWHWANFHEVIEVDTILLQIVFIVLLEDSLWVLEVIKSL